MVRVNPYCRVVTFGLRSIVLIEKKNNLHLDVVFLKIMISSKNFKGLG